MELRLVKAMRNMLVSPVRRLS